MTCLYIDATASRIGPISLLDGVSVDLAFHNADLGSVFHDVSIAAWVFHDMNLGSLVDGVDLV